MPLQTVMGPAVRWAGPPDAAAATAAGRAAGRLLPEEQSEIHSALSVGGQTSATGCLQGKAETNVSTQVYKLLAKNLWMAHMAAQLAHCALIVCPHSAALFKRATQTMPGSDCRQLLLLIDRKPHLGSCGALWPTTASTWRRNDPRCACCMKGYCCACASKLCNCCRCLSSNSLLAASSSKVSTCAPEGHARTGGWLQAVFLPTHPSNPFTLETSLHVTKYPCWRLTHPCSWRDRLLVAKVVTVDSRLTRLSAKVRRVPLTLLRPCLRSYFRASCSLVCALGWLPAVPPRLPLPLPRDAKPCRRVLHSLSLQRAVRLEMGLATAPLGCLQGSRSHTGSYDVQNQPCPDV